MKRVLCVLGTRPEAIKLAPVIRELATRQDVIESRVCSTGQHREMLTQVLDVFNIRPDYSLELMRPNQSLADLTARMLTSLDEVIRRESPDWIIAQGDTTTVLVTSLLAYYHRIRFGHVEAGLRTWDKHNPFPEEVNRRIADVIADIYWCPTQRAATVLQKEHCDSGQIIITGNTVVDAIHYIAGRPYNWDAGPLSEIPKHERIVLFTIHRRESFGDGVRALCQALREIAQAQKDVHFVFPVHLNPNVGLPAKEFLGGVPNVHLVAPLDYIALIHLLRRCELVLTDSGGIQEEAPSFGVPALVMRETTERPEGVEAGVSRLVGTSKGAIVDAALALLKDRSAHKAMSKATNPYGDGRAAERIVCSLCEDFER